jgi:hypothetical protein
VRAEALSPLALTDAEKKAFRMGALAAGAIYADAVSRPCGCARKLENLRIAIAGRSVECDAPEFWPERGE